MKTSRAAMRAVVLASLLFAFALPSTVRARTEAPKLAPSFSLAGRGNDVVASDSLRGKVVYVDFWASWCGPCRRSFPWLAGLQKKYGDQGFAVVAVNLDKTRDAADAFLEKLPAPFAIAYDPDGKAAAAFHVSAMPSSFLVGRDGTVLEAHTGFDPKRAAAIEKLVAEACAK
jgi:cytochrome c biogenesis protein CcmG/thiol:disulfide interchange protein DsbE